MIEQVDNLPGEEWRDMKDYEGLYEVSNLGRVRNYNTGYILKPMRKNGMYLNLWKDKIMQRCRVQRLVALTWIPTDDETQNVIHLNGDIYDCSVDNLAWSKSQPLKRKSFKHLSDSQIAEILNLHNLGLSQYKLAKRFSVTVGCIRRIVRGKDKAA